MLLSFALLLPGVRPALAPEDSGEFVAASSTLGLTHSPGYPLYPLLGRTATFLPWANTAYRVNLLSAVLTATAGGLAAAVAGELGVPFLGSLAIGLVFATAPTVMEVATLAEVHAAAMAAALAALLLFLRWLETGRERFGCGFSAALGVCAVCHPVTLLALPACAWAAWTNGRRPRPARWLAFFLVGLSPLLILAVRGATAPELSWGEPGRLAGWLRVVLRADYGGAATLYRGASPGVSFVQWWGHLRHFLSEAAGAFTWLGAGLFLFGWWRLGRPEDPARPERFHPCARRSLAVFSLLWVLVTGPGFLLLARVPADPGSFAVVERMFWLPLIGLLIPLAAGLHPSLAPMEGKVRGRILGRLLPAALIMLTVVATTRASRGRWDFLAEDLGRNLLRALPPRAVVFTAGDTVNHAFLYFPLVEGRGREHRTVPGLGPAWNRERVWRRFPEFGPFPPDNRAVYERVFALAPRLGWPLAATSRDALPSQYRDRLGRDVQLCRVRGPLMVARWPASPVTEWERIDYFAREAIRLYGWAASDEGLLAARAPGLLNPAPARKR